MHRVMQSHRREKEEGKARREAYESGGAAGKRCQCSQAEFVTRPKQATSMSLVLHFPIFLDNGPNGHICAWHVSLCVHVQRRTIQGLTLWAKAVKTLKQLAPIAILLRRWWLWHRAAHCYNGKPRRTGAREESVYVCCARQPRHSTWQTKKKVPKKRVNVSTHNIIEVKNMLVLCMPQEHAVGRRNKCNCVCCDTWPVPNTILAANRYHIYKPAFLWYCSNSFLKICTRCQRFKLCSNSVFRYGEKLRTITFLSSILLTYPFCQVRYSW